MGRLHFSRLFAGLALAIAALAVVVVAVPHTASAINFFGDACSGAGANSAACSNSKDTITGANGVILRVAELMSIVAGIAAVIIIMIAGLMFITAAGDSNKISTAKQTITYTVVGLIVIFLARAIVVFIVNAM